MFYGYCSTSPFWKEEQKEELYRKFKKKLDLPRMDQSDPRPLWFRNGDPYLQLNSFGVSGVYVRRITKLSEEEYDEMRSKTDTIYEEVMDITEEDYQRLLDSGWVNDPEFRID